MTIPYPLDAFDDARRVRPKPPRRAMDRSKLLSMGLTVAFHAAAIGGLLTMVHVAPARMVKVLTVEITTDKKPAPEIAVAPPPTLAQPTMISVTMPIIPPTAPAPTMVAAPPIAPPAPSRPAIAAKAQAGQRQDYIARLLAQLNRFKQYPPAARKAHIQGVVWLHFVMNAQGHVLKADIAKSSGRAILDQEALALIQRAQPLPPLPKDYPTSTLDAVVPIEFSLNR